MSQERAHRTWPQFVASFLSNDYKGLLAKMGFTIESSPVRPEVVGRLCVLAFEGFIDRRQLRHALRVEAGEPATPDLEVDHRCALALAQYRFR